MTEYCLPSCGVDVFTVFSADSHYRINADGFFLMVGRFRIAYQPFVSVILLQSGGQVNKDQLIRRDRLQGCKARRLLGSNQYNG